MKSHYLKISNKICGRNSAAILSLLIVLICSGCAALKTKNVHQLTRKLDREEEQYSNIALQSKEASALTFEYADSAKAETLVKIIPEGMFSYSPEKGFNGRASSVLISGKKAEWQTVEAASQSNSGLRLDSSGSNSSRIQEKLSIAEKVKQVEKKAWNWKLWGVVVLLAVGFLYYLRNRIMLFLSG